MPTSSQTVPVCGYSIFHDEDGKLFFTPVSGQLLFAYFLLIFQYLPSKPSLPPKLKKQPQKTWQYIGLLSPLFREKNNNNNYLYLGI